MDRAKPRLLAAILAAAAACATLNAIGQVSSAARPLTAASFHRAIAPFPVLDAAGRAYDLPFLGGFDAPRPQFVDIDGDGDADLFVQEYPNALWFFENIGNAKAPRFEWRSDHYQGVEIGEWFRFVDLDSDGDLDLLCELPFSHIRLYRNVGSKTSPKLESGGALKDSDGQDISLDRQNVPAFMDIDCDGRLDLFVGRVEGTVAHYEAERPGGERFTFLTERWEGIEIVGRGAPSFHGANALAFADFDADGDQDLFWGDFFEPGMLLIENIGRTCSTPSFQVDPVQLPFAADTKTSGYNAPAPVDLDRDGDLDFLMGVLGGAFNAPASAADNFYHWERVAPDRFELRTKRFINAVDLGSEAVPALVDLDADGDLDLAVGSKIDPEKGDAGRLSIFLNDGSKTAPSFRLKETLPIADAYNLAPAFGDLDADGDADLLLGTWNQEILFFRNTGSPREPRFVQEPGATIALPRATFDTPALADLDADKDLDLVVGQASGVIAFFRNTGTTKAPRFELVPGVFEGIRAGRRSAPAFVDVDGDGLLDLVVGQEPGGIAAYRNAGTAKAPRFVEHSGFTLPLAPMSAPVFADLDGDGAIDLLSGTVSGGLVFFPGIR